jgi:hypothetical protein
MSLENFKLLSAITKIETIASGHGIRELAGRHKKYGKGRWRKRKGIATVELDDGTIHTAELHFYEAHGIGRRKLKIKYLLD